MIRSKEKNQAKLKAIYGVDFPDALFWLHEFIVEQQNKEDSIDLRAIAIHPCGPLQLLLNFEDLDLVKFTGDPLLYERYYRDVPEFFTYLSGECDGEHWGMLLDEPMNGFCGAASYWSSDGAEMCIYGSIFDALIKQCDGVIDTYIEYAEYAEDDDEDEEEISYYQQQIEICEELKVRIENFVEVNSISLTEGRPRGIKTNTGLSIVFTGDLNDSNALEMLKQGRELWYWDGEEGSEEAFNLMKTAYQMLGKNELIRILETHFHNRLYPVDLIQD